MINHRKTFRFFLLMLAIEVAVVLGALALVAAFAPRDADAHTASATTCDTAWLDAKPGSKWQAKQLCLAAVRRHNCVTHSRRVPGVVTVKGLKLRPGKAKGNSAHWRDQRVVIGWIVNEGLRRDLPRVYVLAALVATTQESSARQLDHGDGSSEGPFQLIDSHGPSRERRTVQFSGNWFYNGARKVYRPGMNAPQLAQAVERSGHPYAYDAWLAESRQTLRLVLGPNCRLRLP